MPMQHDPYAHRVTAVSFSDDESPFPGASDSIHIYRRARSHSEYREITPACTVSVSPCTNSMKSRDGTRFEHYWAVALPDEPNPVILGSKGKTSFDPGCRVLVEWDRGVEIGRILHPILEPPVKAVGKEVKRLATSEELRYNDGPLLAEASSIANDVRRLVESYSKASCLKFHGCRFQYDKSRLVVRYSLAGQRVYFIGLLRSLFQQFRCRIWMLRVNSDGDVDSIATSSHPTEPDGITSSETSSNSHIS